MRAQAGFSHVEITTVLAIIATMLVIAVPSTIVGEPDRPKRTTTQNLRLIRTAIELYVSDHGGEIPGQDGNLAADLEKYFDREDVSAANDWICGGTIRYVDGSVDGKTRSKAGQRWLYDVRTGEVRAAELRDR